MYLLYLAGGFLCDTYNRKWDIENGPERLTTRLDVGRYCAEDRGTTLIHRKCSRAHNPCLHTSNVSVLFRIIDTTYEPGVVREVWKHDVTGNLVRMVKM